MADEHTHIYFRNPGTYKISCRLTGSSVAHRHDTLQAMLQDQKELLMSVYTELLAQVTVIDDLKGSIITFVNGQNTKLDDLAAQLADALKGNPEGEAMVADAIAQLKGDAEEISAAITAGTPAA